MSIFRANSINPWKGKLIIKTVTLLVILFIGAPAGFCQEEPFTISTSYNNLLSNPQKTGMLDLLMYELFGRLGLPCELVYTETLNSIYDVNSGVLDGDINRIEGMEATYPNLVRVPEANMVMEFVAFSKKDIPINGWESLKDLDIGIVRGWKILEDHTRDFPFVTFVPTEVELFTMLDKGRIDVALYSKLTGYAVVQDLALTGIRHLSPPLARREMFLYVHSSHKNLVTPLAETLREIKADGTYDRIVADTTRGYIPSDR
ncbi:MAG: transporter substrate-binding domain-containing protein [Spirochaetales bacterium]|nr:transporter substrate-binding domain-containing protein [Spirochaetales bacterium]